MAENQYTYAVARIRSKELSLLTQPVLEQLLACKSMADCLRLLVDKGWGKSGDETAEQLLRIESEKTWDLMRELVGDLSVFDTFLYGNNFHNLKAAIKEVYQGQQNSPHIYIHHGTLEPKKIYEAVKQHDFSLLPGPMQQCAKEAYEVQLHTGDSQLCDVIVDQAALETIHKMGKGSGNQLLADYAELKVVTANIQIAIRSYKTGKKKEFLERALAKCDTLDTQKLAEAVLGGEEAIYEYLGTTAYVDAVEAIKQSPSSFEKWCDNLMIRQIKRQKYNPFTLSPLAAYVLARENEIKSVRMLLSGKLNHLPEACIRERLREMYV